MTQHSWVKTDFHFGVPYANFQASLRWLHANEPQFGDILAQSDPVMLELAIQSLLKKYRPELDQPIIIGMFLNSSFWLEFQVVHPSLPRTNVAASPNRLRIDKCPVCHGEFDREFVWCRLTADGLDQEVCSKACCDADEKPAHVVERQSAI